MAGLDQQLEAAATQLRPLAVQFPPGSKVLVQRSFGPPKVGIIMQFVRREGKFQVALGALMVAAALIPSPPLSSPGPAASE